MARRTCRAGPTKTQLSRPTRLAERDDEHATKGPSERSERRGSWEGGPTKQPPIPGRRASDGRAEREPERPAGPESQPPNTRERQTNLRSHA